MLRTTIALMVLVATLSLAPAVRASEPYFDGLPGRYQLTVADNLLYVIDTTTGQCWSKRVTSKSWTDHGSPVPKQPEEVAEEPLSLNLPSDLVSLTIKQRRSRTIPGSGNRIRVNLDDITGGQVIISIVGDGDVVLLEETSLKPGKVAAFELDEQEYFVRIKEMTNVLIGTDLAIVEIASHPDKFPKEEAVEPKAEEGAAEEDDDGA